MDAAVAAICFTPSREGIPMSFRTERVSKLLQREIAEILQTEFGGQLPTLFTVTNVRVTKDLSIAYVDVSVYGEELSQRQAAFRHLEELTVQIRSSLANRIRHQVRIIPDVRFFLDESIHEAKRMEDLFDRIRAERERREAES
jgi:ribosome-binding factor A